MSKIWVVIIIIVIVAAGGYFLMQENKTASPELEETPVPISQTETPAQSGKMEQSITLSEQNKSGESGTAVLTEKDGKVLVTINTTGGLVGVPQPAHIHTGACPDVGAVVYPLSNVIDGKSETLLDVTFAELAAQQPLGINVHKSVPEVKVYISCGDLNLPMAISSSAPAVSPASMNKSGLQY